MNIDAKREKFRALLPASQFSVQPDQLAVAAIDESSLPPVTPLAVLWAESADDVQRVIQCCNETSTPVTLRGGGSALEGSAIPVAGGIVLDTSRMKQVLEFRPDDLQVRVQPGIIYDDLNSFLKREALFFPPSPGGSGSLATIGGMVATNASGIYTVKYGATKDYLLELEIVTGSGEKQKIGSRALKRSSGYNLVDLICGSEGTLAAVTSITLKLAGLPEGRRQAAFSFPDEIRAAKAVSTIRRYGIDIAAIEFLDRQVMMALNQLKNYGLAETPSLFVEFHGAETVTKAALDLTGEVCTELDGLLMQFPEGKSPWEIRHYVTESIKHRRPGYSIIRNDIAFPISALPEMVAYCLTEAEKSKIMMHTFGHVGMGLLHALMLARRDNEEEWKDAQDLNRKIIREAVSFGGTISGEHGIGLSHVDLMPLEHGDSLSLMRGIKRQFDPKGIMNPGKIIP